MGRSGFIGLPAAGALVKLAPCGGKAGDSRARPVSDPGYWRQAELTSPAFDRKASIVWAMR
jgi:hypothetical protein